MLNAKTGLAVASTGREYSVVIPEKYKGTTGKNAQIFLFLATSPEKMNIEVNAVNAANEVLSGRIFEAYETEYSYHLQRQVLLWSEFWLQRQGR